MENVWPATVNCETSTALDFGFESVTILLTDCPTGTEPKSTELGDTVRPELPPVPLAANTFVEYPQPETVVRIRATQHAQKT